MTPWPTGRFNKCDGPCGSLPNYSQIFQVKTTNIYYLTVSVDQKSGNSLPWCPCLKIANKSPRLQSRPWVWQKEDQLPSIFTPLGGTQCLMSCRIEGPSYFLNIGQRPLSFLPQSGQLMTQQLWASKSTSKTEARAFGWPYIRNVIPVIIRSSSYSRGETLQGQEHQNVGIMKSYLKGGLFFTIGDSAKSM